MSDLTPCHFFAAIGTSLHVSAQRTLHFFNAAASIWPMHSADTPNSSASVCSAAPFHPILYYKLNRQVAAKGQPMIVVYKYGYPAGTDTPDMSPFVVKLETWLRMSGIPYETCTGGSSHMPKAKLPSSLIDGRMIADSSLIIEHLQQHDARALTDAQLSAVQQAQAEAIKALVETHLYFINFYLRWCVDDNFARYRPMLFDYARRSMPAWQRPLLPIVGPVVLSIIRRQKVDQVWQQGTGRHTYDEVVAMGLKGLQAFATLLGRQPYLLGESVSSVDATGFALVHTLACHPFPSAMQEFVLAHPELMAYQDRIWQRYWTGATP